MPPKVKDNARDKTGYITDLTKPLLSHETHEIHHLKRQDKSPSAQQKLMVTSVCVWSLHEVYVFVVSGRIPSLLLTFIWEVLVLS